MSDWWMMLHTLPRSIQPAVNWPTVKHAGPANHCHTWRFGPQIKTMEQVFCCLSWPSLRTPKDNILCGNNMFYLHLPPTEFRPHVYLIWPYLQFLATHKPCYWSNLTAGWVNRTVLPVQWAATVLCFMKEISQGALLICSCYPCHY